MSTPIELRIINGKIDVKPSGPDVPTNSDIRFYTDHPTAQFEIALHNPEQFFGPSIPRVHSFLVYKGHDETLTVHLPNNGIRTKYYSVCEVLSGGVPQPLPPDAPPRIIRY